MPRVDLILEARLLVFPEKDRPLDFVGYPLTRLDIETQLDKVGPKHREDFVAAQAFPRPGCSNRLRVPIEDRYDGLDKSRRFMRPRERRVANAQVLLRGWPGSAQINLPGCRIE